jgi:hypothetical protein
MKVNTHDLPVFFKVNQLKVNLTSFALRTALHPTRSGSRQYAHESTSKGRTYLSSPTALANALLSFPTPPSTMTGCSFPHPAHPCSGSKHYGYEESRQRLSESQGKAQFTFAQEMCSSLQVRIVESRTPPQEGQRKAEGISEAKRETGREGDSISRCPEAEE